MALLNVAKDNKVDLSLINSVITSNSKRKVKMAEKIAAALDGKISGKKITLLGLAFKANTDDIRYSPAIVIAKELAKNGAEILTHDPEAIENSKRELAEFKNIKFCADVYEAMEDADLIVITTEWKEYRDLDLAKIKTKKIVDLRNLFDAKEMKKAGFEYFYIGGKN
jgi:UDPglucose 6-dehydrogenase